MSSVKGYIRPVWYKKGKCPSAKSHFKTGTCCREVYSYLEMLARNNKDGFIFPTVADIARHTRKWKHHPAKCEHSRHIGVGHRPGSNKIFYIHLDEEGSVCNAVPSKHFTKKECDRAIKELQRLQILGPRCVRIICGVTYSGWYLFSHETWTIDINGLCELKHWEQNQVFTDENVPLNVPSNGALNVPSNVSGSAEMSH